MITLNNLLKQLRKNNKLTCEEVSEKVGISKEYYWMIENGERRGFSYTIAKKIAAVFNKKPDDIFFNEELTKEKRKEVG